MRNISVILSLVLSIFIASTLYISKAQEADPSATPVDDYSYSYDVGRPPEAFASPVASCVKCNCTCPLPDGSLFTCNAHPPQTCPEACTKAEPMNCLSTQTFASPVYE